MHIFNTGNKINFIDTKNNIVGWDNGQSCCEDARWAFVEEIPSSFDIINLYDKSKTIQHFSEYYFDTTQSDPIGLVCDNNEQNAVAFRIIMDANSYNKTPSTAYLILSNKHNGYYSHGFTFSKPLIGITGSL